jgi:hypothetical protein
MNVFGSGRTVADVAVDMTVECMDDRGTRHQLDVVLGYRRSDPYAVTMTFLTGAGDLTWTFGRDLLVHGINMPTGQGDVHVAPSIGVDGRSIVHIELTSPDGHLVLQAKVEDVAEFLGRSDSVVPVGGENLEVDVDLLIAQLLEA